MARRRYRKFYRRSKGRWSANIKNVDKTATFNFTGAEITQGGTLWLSDLMAENPAQTDNTVSQTYTVKNFDFSFYIEHGNNLTFLENFCCFIVYVPQGFTVDENIIKTHPEWIMAMRFIGETKNDTTQQYYLPFRVKTRMARKLNTGDSIHFLITGVRDPYNTSTNTAVVISVKGIVRWWTKAN